MCKPQMLRLSKNRPNGELGSVCSDECHKNKGYRTSQFLYESGCPNNGCQFSQPYPIDADELGRERISYRLSNKEEDSHLLYNTGHAFFVD